MNAKVNFSHGNREVTMSIGGAEKWEKATMSRTYFTLAFAGAKLPPVDKLYEVLAGGTKDDTIQVHGRTFGYQLGISCDSKTKRAAAIQAITELLTAHFAPAPAPAASEAQPKKSQEELVKLVLDTGEYLDSVIWVSGFDSTPAAAAYEAAKRELFDCYGVAVGYDGVYEVKKPIVWKA